MTFLLILFREKIRELITKCNEAESKKSMQKEHKEIQTTQTSLQNQDCDTQTDPIVPETKPEIESSTKKNSEKQLEETESSIVDEASEYVKRYTDLLDSQMSFQSASASTLKKKPVASVFILLDKEK